MKIPSHRAEEEKKTKQIRRSDGRTKKNPHECGKATAADAHSVGSNRGDSNVQLVFLRFHWVQTFPNLQQLVQLFF
jgi:hypothetical protein